MITQEFFKLFIEQFDSSINWSKIHNAIGKSSNIYKEYYHKCNWQTVKGDIFEFIAKYIILYKDYEQVYLYKDIPISLKEIPTKHSLTLYNNNKKLRNVSPTHKNIGL